LTTLLSKKLLSQDVTNFMKACIDNNPSKAELLNQINVFLSNKKFSTNDKKVIVIQDFKDLYLYSASFWASFEEDLSNQSSQNKSRCNAGDQRNFADAFGGMIGGVLGSSFPPFGTMFGAFVGSQGMSAIVRSIQNYHGGGCI
jgi:hypothetical protein